MIQSVDNSSAAAVPAAQPAATPASNGGASSFASALASAQQQTGGARAEGTLVGDVKTHLKPPKGETWGAVAGHADYADILSGPRNGFFVSLVGPRKGQTFVIVHKAGQTFHVYGDGKHKHWVPVRPDPADFKPLKGETWTPVDHHRDFKKIEGGKRNREFVNLSGNERTGETFKIAHHDGKTWHVYGDGTQVAVGGHRKQASQKTDRNASQPG